jgi:hypothetical protein
MSLRKRLIFILLIFATIPMGVVSLANFYSSKANIIAEKTEAFEIITDLKKNTIDNFFHEKMKSVMIAKEYYNIKINLPILNDFKHDKSHPSYVSAKQILDEQLKLYQKVSEAFDVMLTNTEGRIIYASNDDHSYFELGSLLPDPGNLAFLKGKEDIYITKMFKNSVANNELSILVSGPIFDDKETFIGVIVLEVNMSPLFKILQDKTGLGETGETVIGRASENGALFLCPLRYDDTAALTREEQKGQRKAFPLLEAVQKKEGMGISVDYRGETVLSVWRFLPSLKWGIVTKIDTKEVFSSVSKSGKINLLITSITFLLACIMTFIVCRSIFSPIKALQKGINIIRGGNLSFQIDTHANDEIGELSRTFYEMVKEIEAQRIDIEENLKKTIVENRLQTAQFNLNNIMNKEKTVKGLTLKTLSYLSSYLKCQVGLFYLLENDETLVPVARYAYTTSEKESATFKIGEGLVGQVALEKQPIVFHDLPEDHFMINTAIGKFTPKTVLGWPIFYYSTLLGVLVLGTSKELIDPAEKFLKKVEKNIANSIFTAQSIEHTQKLLEQRVIQEKELKITNELLRTQQEKLGIISKKIVSKSQKFNENNQKNYE